MRQFQLAMNAIVIRTKENYYTMIEAKLQQLPWGEAGLEWLDQEIYAGKTPRQLIELGDGLVVETTVDDLLAINEAYTALFRLQERFGHIPQLQGVWEAFEQAKPAYPWK